MIKLGMAVICLIGVFAASQACAQVIPPLQAGGPAQGALRQLRPLSPAEQVREQSMRQAPPLPLPPSVSDRWVAERRMFLPDLGREVIIPGHYERRVSDQQYLVPSLPIYDVGTGLSTVLPGGVRPPAELRQGP